MAPNGPGRYVPNYLKIKECAGILNLAPEFIRREIRAGRGPEVRKFGSGKRHVFRVTYDALMEWANKGKS